MKKYIFLLILIVGGVYANTLINSFVYDDVFFVVHNAFIKDLHAVPLYFVDPVTVSNTTHSIWRPLRTLSYAFDYAVWGLRPFGFHLTNVILHVFNAILVMFVARRFFNKLRYLASSSSTVFRSLPLITALLWAVHPVQTETVAWVSSRGDLLYVFWGLLALLFFSARYRNRLQQGLTYCISLGCFMLALLSKETACVFPLAFILWELFFHRREFIAQWGWVRSVPFVLGSCAYMGVRYLVLGSIAQRAYWGGSFFSTIFTMLEVVPIVARVIVWPRTLQVIYRPVISGSLCTVQAMIGLGLIAVLLISVFACLRYRNKVVLFCLLWGILFFLPTSNIIPLKGLFSEHFLYLSMFGVALFGAAGIWWVARTLNDRGLSSERYMRIVRMILILIIGMFAVRTWERNFDWRSDYTLWSAELLHGAPTAEAYTGRGIVLGRQGRYSEAIEDFKQALVLNPMYDVAQYSLAVSYLGIDPPRVDLARQHLRAAQNLGFRPHPGMEMLLLEDMPSE